LGGILVLLLIPAQTHFIFLLLEFHNCTGLASFPKLGSVVNSEKGTGLNPVQN
jgi:hypothetical protein